LACSFCENGDEKWESLWLILLLQLEKMECGKQFDDLPNEILLKIFSYLSIENLSLSTHSVSMHWRKVSQHFQLWRNAVFNARKDITNKEIVKYLENMAALKTIFCCVRNSKYSN
jgi:hypothetical protein